MFHCIKLSPLCFLESGDLICHWLTLLQRKKRYPWINLNFQLFPPVLLPNTFPYCCLILLRHFALQKPSVLTFFCSCLSNPVYDQTATITVEMFDFSMFPKNFWMLFRHFEGWESTMCWTAIVKVLPLLTSCWKLSPKHSRTLCHVVTK